LGVILIITLSFLKRSERVAHIKYVWIGSALSIIAGVVLGVFVYLFYGGLAEKELFEGVASYLAVIVLTAMLYWMASKKHLKSEIEQRIESSRTPIVLLGFTFIVAFREVLETVLLLTPFFVRDVISTVGGMLAGVFVAIGIAYVVYRLSMKLNLRPFFYFTSILLVFVASDLAGYGTP